MPGRSWSATATSPASPRISLAMHANCSGFALPRSIASNRADSSSSPRTGTSASRSSLRVSRQPIARWARSPHGVVRSRCPRRARARSNCSRYFVPTSPPLRSCCCRSLTSKRASRYWPAWRMASAGSRTTSGASSEPWCPMRPSLSEMSASMPRPSLRSPSYARASA